MMLYLLVQMFLTRVSVEVLKEPNRQKMVLWLFVEDLVYRRCFICVYAIKASWFVMNFTRKGKLGGWQWRGRETKAVMIEVWGGGGLVCCSDWWSDGGSCCSMGVKGEEQQLGWMVVADSERETQFFGIWNLIVVEWIKKKIDKFVQLWLQLAIF